MVELNKDITDSLFKEVIEEVGYELVGISEN
jgi:hypothetical protein